MLICFPSAASEPKTLSSRAEMKVKLEKAKHAREQGFFYTQSAVRKRIQKAALKGNLFFTARRLILMSRIIKMADVHCNGT